MVLSSLGYLPAHVLLSKTFFQPAVRLYAYLVVEKQKVTFRIHSILFFFFFFFGPAARLQILSSLTRD